MKTLGSISDFFLRPFGLALRRRRFLSVPQMNRIEISRFLYMKRLFDKIDSIEGDIVECGVGKGISLLYLVYLAKEEMKFRKIWGFDSFDGFPVPSEHDQSVRNPKRGEWGDTSIQQVLDLFKIAGVDDHFIYSQITLVKGFFDESLKKYGDNKIAYLHIDVDLYDSYLTVLKLLYPKVITGGVILFDEYMETLEHAYFPGAQKAINEFFKDDVIKIKRDKFIGKYYFIKE